MPAVGTRADSLHIFGTGAGSDGGTQASPDASLGNYRSSREVVPLGVTIASPISNVSVDFIAGANGPGTGTLTATGSDTLAWTPPGGSQGANVTILNGESWILEGSNLNQYIRVTRTSATALSGTATLTLAEVYNNDVGFDNVSSAEASAGDNEYRCICLKNMNSVQAGSVTAFVGTLGTQQVSDGGQLGASGSGTITTSGTFADWPASGFAHIKTSGGTTREIVYYASRTTTVLTVPSGGRAQLTTSAAAGSSSDTLDAVPGIRIAKEAPTSSHAQTIADENTAPTTVTFSYGITAATGLAIGNMAASALYFIWIHRAVPAGMVATPTELQKIELRFDAA